MTSGDVIIGTSGWQYDDWRGRFYPKDLSKTSWLAYFSRVFPSVEVNNSFYQLPRESAFARWREQTPSGFVVTVKANRFITHIKRLKDCGEPLELFWSRCVLLGDKLGPILFQLPPRFAADHERLRAFIRLLPKQMRAAFEFRDQSWETEETYDILDGAGAAFVIPDWPDREPPIHVTGGWSYVRLHKGGKIRPGYSRRKLERWADVLRELGAEQTYVYFNNDTGGAALRDAVTLTGMLTRRGVPTQGPSGLYDPRASA
jgi:uncharacterized protein YecE (DUF72 family)